MIYKLFLAVVLNCIYFHYCSYLSVSKNSFRCNSNSKIRTKYDSSNLEADVWGLFKGGPALHSLHRQRAGEHDPLVSEGVQVLALIGQKGRDLTEHLAASDCGLQILLYEVNVSLGVSIASWALPCNDSTSLAEPSEALAA